MGLRVDDIGTGKTTWSDVIACIRYADRDSAYVRAKFGKDAGWGLTQELLAVIADSLAHLSWQTGGGKGVRPKPMPRPSNQAASTTIGKGTSMTPAEFDAWWDRHEREGQRRKRERDS